MGRGPTDYAVGKRITEVREQTSAGRFRQPVPASRQAPTPPQRTEIGYHPCSAQYGRVRRKQILISLWAKDLYDLFLEMRQCVKDQKARDAPLTQRQWDQWYKHYRKILRVGRQANPLTPKQLSRKRRKQSKEQNLLDRLEGYDECILAFLWNFTLPFTNNQAERDFRNIKTRVNISGCFRTLAGARRHARIRKMSALHSSMVSLLEKMRASPAVIRNQLTGAA